MTTYKAEITAMQIVDETNDLIATIECQDECTAMVNIKSPMNAHGWSVLSGQILFALKSMELEGDAK